MVYQGILAAILSAFFLGTYILPRKHSRLSPYNYQIIFALAVFLFSIVYILIAKTRIFPSSNVFWFGVMSGIFWAIGYLAYIISVDYIGVTRSTYIKNLGPVIITLYGVLIFKEFTLDQPIKYAAVMIGSLLMFGATALVANSRANHHEIAKAYNLELSDQIRNKLKIYGYLCAAFTAITYGIAVVFIKMMLQEGYRSTEANLYLSFGILVSSCFIFWLKEKKINPFKVNFNEYKRCFLAGGLFVTSTVLAIFAMNAIPMSVSWPITNLCAIVTLLFGVFLYHEVDLTSHTKGIIYSVIFYLIGLFLLGYSLVPSS